MDIYLALKVEKFLRIVLLLALLALLICIIFVPLDSCDMISFKYNNKTLKSQEFMKVYKDKCLTDNNFNASYEMQSNIDFSNLKVPNN